MLQEGNSFQAEVFVPVWTSLLYANEWFKTNSTPFLASVTDTGADYVVELENLLNVPLSNLRVVINQAIFELNTVGPREKKTVRLDPANGIALRTFVQQNGAYFQSALERRRNSFGDSGSIQLENRPLTATVASFISQLDTVNPGHSFVAPAGLDLTTVAERGDAIVFAWLPNYSFCEPINQFTPPRFTQDTLMRLSVSLKQKNSI
jgi:hypothetical protein